jgi:uncharacterized protein YkwD
MQRSVTRPGWARKWAGSRASAALLVAGVGVAAVSVAALSVVGCSGEAEVTTELPEADSNEPSGTNASSGTGVSPDSENDGLSSNEATPSGLSGEAPLGTAEAGAGGNGPVALDPLDVPGGDYCAAVSEWPAAWLQFEQEVLLLVNERRAQAADCGAKGTFGPTGPLVMEPTLRCSARLQSLDMFERGFFDHTNPDGLDPFQRMSAAGFHGSGAGENIAVGQASPQQVMRSWMDSDDHCANVMRPSYSLLGVGYHPGAGRRGLGSNFWTQNFGAPAAVRGCGRNCR